MALYTKKVKYDTFKREPPHPYPPFLRDDTKYLFIGTFPTSAPKKFEFFYSGENNWFWKIIAGVFDSKFIYNEGLKAKEVREKLLEEKKIGIIDMLEECYRKNNSAKDSNLYPIKFMDVLAILDSYKNISTLIFTSRTPAVGALGLFNIHVYQKGYEMIEPRKLKGGLMVGNFLYGGITYRIFVPYSPSQSSKKSKNLGVKGLTEMYKECFSQ